MADDSLFLIDIDKILREKAPKQSKYIPKFVVSYLKHIVHQEELNVFLRESKDKVGVDFLKACLEFLAIHFEGRNSNFFYNLANLCKILGIKFNIAMLYLADEMLKNRHKTFTITIGKPIPWQTFDKSKSPAGWAQYVKDIVYKL